MAFNTSSKLVSGSATLTISGGESSLTTNTSITASAAAMIDEDVVTTPEFKSEPQPTIPSVDKEGDDDTMSYFQKLANE